MKPRPKQPEAASGEDEWLLTYADAITLLMAFFVMLASVSKIDLPVFEQVQAGIKKDVAKQENIETPIFSLFGNLNSILEQAEVQKEQAEVSFDDLGVVVEFNSNTIYHPGSAELLPKAKDVLAEIAKEVVKPSYELYFIDVEGHTDDVPISTERFPSNWELSTARAAGVVRYFVELGLVPERLKASGYADVKPKLPNRDLYGEGIPENRAVNRRIVLRLHP